ncbi:hypothetical protein HW845_23690 [Streptomyces sp. ND05-3B]|nr:hypothetical protein [Streptomyces caniscabiei]UJV46930.1 hypothetical protein CVT30_31155 [Streptomyces sp. AMCC400023]MBE4757359.1 hypothetical protein [Streptomyces caniscabiei]MBE4769358.1 hypothetical protein [Streptomyces caniscabiei]MBE4784921.1 hypothetical protein [Streptomyces caniscabiei]
MPRDLVGKGLMTHWSLEEDEKFMNVMGTKPIRRPGATRPATQRTATLATIDTREPRVQRFTGRVTEVREARPAGAGEFNSSI